MSTVHIRFAARRSAGRHRSPLLERLISGAPRAAAVPDWRAAAFRVLSPETASPPSIGAAAWHAASRAAGPETRAAAAWACVATPVHFSAGMSTVILASDGVLTLDADEAALLAVDFNRVFDGAGVRLSAIRNASVRAELLCTCDESLAVATQDPELAAGHDVFGFQPAGRDAPRLKRLMSEMEMWLFEHDVNRARAFRDVPPVSALWLWGGGLTGEPVCSVHGWTAGADPLFAAFGCETKFPDEAHAVRSGVVVCEEQPGTDEWGEVERRWLAPAVAALRAGRIERLELSAAARCFSVGRGPNLRFWHRPRPWWESYGME